MLLLIIPAAILENFKVGYSTMRIMFMKVVYSLLSFLLVGMAFGAALAGWHLEKFQSLTGIQKNHPALVCVISPCGLIINSGGAIIQHA